jgi:hypothetical protein
MTFFAPALLALGLAVAVPVALHLLQRQPGPRMVFPAVRYLRRAEREQATRLRLRQLLLLAARVLALLLLAAAAARPFLDTGGAEHHPTSVVIILDNSMTSGAVVGDRRVLDELQDVALRTVAAAGPEDRIWLVRAGQPWLPAVAGSPETVAAAVRATEPAATVAPLANHVQRAASILAAEPAGRAREIHLLSDLRAPGLESHAGDGPDIPVVVLEPPATPPTNRAITDVEIGGGLPPRAGAGSSITVTVETFGAATEPASTDSVDVRLFIDGAMRAAGRAVAGASVVLPFPAASAGVVTGHVEVDGDALAADDRRHFAVRVRPPPTVALSVPAPFVDEALSVLDAAGRLRLGGPGAADVVVSPGAVGADAVRRGAAVVVLPPDSPLELAAANQRLAGAGIPWRLSPPVVGESRLDSHGSGLESVLEGARLRQVYGLEPVGEARDTVLLRTGAGAPWAVAGAAGAGRFLILGTPLTPAGGTLPTSAAMLPLVDRAVTAWSADEPAGIDHRPGDVVTLPAGDSILRPGGGADLASAGSVYRLTEPGIYRVMAGPETVAAFAVNPPPEASGVTTLAPRAAAAMLAGANGRVSSADGWERAIFGDRLGRDLTLPILALAILVLMAEMGLAAGRAGVGREREMAAAPSPVPGGAG